MGVYRSNSSPKSWVLQSEGLYLSGKDMGESQVRKGFEKEDGIAKYPSVTVQLDKQD